jgi:hypothetical protein
VCRAFFAKIAFFGGGASFADAAGAEDLAAAFALADATSYGVKLMSNTNGMPDVVEQMSSDV